MSTILIKNIGTLVQTRRAESADNQPLRKKGLAELPFMENAWLLIEGNRIKDFGAMTSCPESADQIIDASGKMVFPCWCDSHTHLVFAKSRESEFVDRINGLTYAEIAAKGGGILNSARRLQEMPEDELLEQSYARLQEIIWYGTGAVEIKSGYGLTLESELKMLRVISRLKKMSEVKIKSTFLGAHALPMAYKNNRAAYLKLVIEEMLPKIANEGLADFIDVFCEKGFFSVLETEKIMNAGESYGLKAKIHTNQFNSMGGIQAAVKHNALSVDHLEVVNVEEMSCLQNASTIATLLPSAPFFLNDHYPPARQLIDKGVAVALASDFNPGTTPSGRMSFVISLACIKMKMLPEEAINAATINGAYAMDVAQDLGSIEKGKTANIFITKSIPSFAYIPYAFGSNIVETVIINGKIADKAKV